MNLLKNYKCILYDEKNTCYYDAIIESISYDPTSPYRHMELACLSNSEKIQLDDETMKKVAKHNKDVEVQKVIDEIERKVNELNSVRKDIQRLKNKLSECEEILND